MDGDQLESLCATLCHYFVPLLCAALCLFPREFSPIVKNESLPLSFWQWFLRNEKVLIILEWPAQVRVRAPFWHKSPHFLVSFWQTRTAVVGVVEKKSTTLDLMQSEVFMFIRMWRKYWCWWYDSRTLILVGSWSSDKIGVELGGN